MCHEFSSPAASTPCTDGERVYAYFGSFGLLAYDFTGQEIWQRLLDRLPIQPGTVSSPILAGGHLIRQRDGDSTNAPLVALAPATSKTVWKSTRPLAGLVTRRRWFGGTTVSRNSWCRAKHAPSRPIASDVLYTRNAAHLWAFVEGPYNRR